jgi:hypothetical protein
LIDHHGLESFVEEDEESGIADSHLERTLCGVVEGVKRLKLDVSS